MKDVIIIGGGPAGLSCAIYLKRYGLDISIIEGGVIGGDVNITSEVDNYLGFPNISGLELAKKFKEHIDLLDINVINDTVVDVTKSDNFIIIGEKNKYEAKYVVLATGRSSRKLEVPSEEKFIGKGISFCATCDGPLTKNRNVIVIGGGNSAFEESLYIAKFAKSVTILVRNQVRADEVLQEEVKNNPKITVSLNEEVKEFIGDMVLRKVITNKRELDTDFAFIYIGLNPEAGCLKSLNVEKENNHIKVNAKMETSIPGLYACGDVIFKTMYQIASSVYEGSEAAFSIYKHNKSQNI